ncbi:carbohydrate kinase [Pseudoxanthobacter sp.]|uniref:carbohydrate kinase n=1 Tax=Pseudoxanthobacter sp. TaxID=1925742 RepID=UPI002FE3F7E3
MHDLNEQERAILARIDEDPFISQQALAEALGLGRSTVATYIAQLVRKGHLLGRAYVRAPQPAVLVIGGAVLDRKYRLDGPLVPGSSNPVSSARTFGGVGRNVAEVLARLGIATELATVVGDDEAGRALLEALKAAGVGLARTVALPGARTAEYVAVLTPDGHLVAGLADMDIFATLTPADIARLAPALARAGWVFAETNLPAETIAALLARRREGRFRLAMDAVSVAKAARLPAGLTGIDVLFLNADEGVALTGRADPAAAAAALLAAGAGTVVLTCGAAGAWICDAAGPRLLPAPPAKVVDVTGAGDTLVGVALAALASGHGIDDAVGRGMAAAADTIGSAASIAPALSPALLAS